MKGMELEVGIMEKKKKPLGMRIGESVFCIGYLLFALIAGLIFLKRCLHDPQYVNLTDDMYRFAALMTFALMIGDAFHLIPRVVINIGGEREKDAFWLGLGNLISSITMTAFYILLYFVIYYATYPYHISTIRPTLLDGFHRTFFILLMVFAVIRVVLCLFPQNNWFRREGNHKWSILRNIPFTLMGVTMIIFLLMNYLKVHNGEILLSFLPAGSFVLMAVLVAFSFVFYLSVVLYAHKSPKMGMLMIPKTICYIALIAVLL